MPRLLPILSPGVTLFAARRDGRLACAQHWVAERGYRLAAFPGGAP